MYNIHTRVRNVCELCTAFITATEASIISVRLCHITAGTGTTFVYLPRTSLICARLHYRARNVCDFCTTSIPVPGTSVRSARHSLPYPELLYAMYGRATKPCVRMQHPYTYSDLLSVGCDFHAVHRPFGEKLVTPRYPSSFLRRPLLRA